MRPERGRVDEGHREPRTRAGGFEPRGTVDASRWGTFYPFVMLAQTLAAAALLIAALLVNGPAPPDGSGGAATVEAATRLALAIVFVAVYVPATATLLQWHAERREARRLIDGARREVEAILRTRRR
jgi:hypothetical protein